MRTNASFAMLSVGVALLGAGCPTTYITVESDGGLAAGSGGGGYGGGWTAGMGGGWIAGAGGYGGADDGCESWYPYDSPEYWSCVNGGAGVGGAAGYPGSGGYGGGTEPCGGYGGGYAGEGGYGGGYAGTGGGYAGEGGYGGGYAGEGGYGGGYAGTGGGYAGEGGYGGGYAGEGGYGGIGGAGGDPCGGFSDPGSICSCYYGVNNAEFYGCLNRYDAQNGGVGGAAATLCEQYAPWSEDHAACIAYFTNGGAGSYAPSPE